jgi:prepilin-type N-terminal cleavage/methylation domain-containing protein
MTTVTAIKGRNEGFTLIEIMIALTILAVGILGVVGLFVTAIGGNAQGRKVTEATSIAQSRLDELVSDVGYLELHLEPGVEYDLNVFGSHSAPADGLNYPAFYNLTTSLENVTSIIDPSTGLAVDVEMYKITVTSFWVTKGRRHEVTFETLRAED